MLVPPFPPLSSEEVILSDMSSIELQSASALDDLSGKEYYLPVELELSAERLADLGHEVACVDSDREQIDKMNSGTSPIYKAGLEQLRQRKVAARKLWATADLNDLKLDSPY